MFKKDVSRKIPGGELQLSVSITSSPAKLMQDALLAFYINSSKLIIYLRKIIVIK